MDPVEVTGERLVDPQGLNLYGYVINRPIVMVDPDGNDYITNSQLIYEVGQVLGDGTIYTYGIVSGDENYIQVAKDGFKETTENWDELGKEITEDAAWKLLPLPTSPSRVKTGIKMADKALDTAKKTEQVRVKVKPIKNKLSPDPKATGAHSVYKNDSKTGEITSYETYKPQSNPKNPNKWEVEKKYHGTEARGGGHFNKKERVRVKTPHVHDPKVPGKVRVPRKDEIPKK